MSRGRNRRKKISKPRAHLVQEKRDIRAEEEFLDQQVDFSKLGNYGDDALLKAIVYDLPNASEAEAMELALQLQKRLRGDASLLENPEMSDMIQGIREEAREIDKAAEAYERSKETFVDDVIASAPKLTDAQRDKLVAKGKAEFKNLVQKARADKAYKKLRLMEMLKQAPEVEIAVAGHYRNVSGQMRIEPETISIMGVNFRLSPGVHKVPKPIADVYQGMIADRRHRDAKERLLRGEGSQMGTYDQATLDQKLQEVNQEFGSN